MHKHTYNSPSPLIQRQARFMEKWQGMGDAQVHRIAQCRLTRFDIHFASFRNDESIGQIIFLEITVEQSRAHNYCWLMSELITNQKLHQTLHSTWSSSSQAQLNISHSCLCWWCDDFIYFRVIFSICSGRNPTNRSCESVVPIFHSFRYIPCWDFDCAVKTSCRKQKTNPDRKYVIIFGHDLHTRLYLYGALW